MEKLELLKEITTMSSLEIASISGRNHFDLLKAIRKMEPAWEKVTESNFTLSEYKDSTGRKLPMYELTKTECLYVAAKFNDEVRAKLVLRWEELEHKLRREKLTNVEPVMFSGQSLYNYKEVLREFGYSTKSSAMGARRRRYSYEFTQNGREWFTTLVMVKYLHGNYRSRKNREDVLNSKTILPNKISDEQLSINFKNK